MQQASVSWIILPAMIVAAIAGFLLGKRSRKKAPEQALLSGNEVPVLDNLPPPPPCKAGKQKEYISEEKPFLQKYDKVTVLFADIEGFSEITDNLTPEALLEELNSFFFYFDTIVDRYHIEKIKTIGDAYMCAGGLPHKNHTNPVEVILVAIDVQNHLSLLRRQNPNVWSIRIGIHTGQVVAGMLGHKKVSFDIWGHTVNVASRMETSCKAGEINISGTTYELVNRFFDCEYQGKLTDFNEDSYYVKGLKPEFVEKTAGGQLVPNRNFTVQMQMLRLIDLEEYVECMMKDMESRLFFHNYKHALDVYEHVELLGHSENIGSEDMLLLKTAALLHDIGYSVTYENVLAVSEEMARETLRLFQYDQQQIDTVCRLMKASHYESEPTDILEQIMHDANLIYFGRADFISRTMNLFHEEKIHQSSVIKTEWLQRQIDLLSKLQFYTHAAGNLIKIPTDQQIANTEEEIISDKSGE